MLRSHGCDTWRCPAAVGNIPESIEHLADHSVNSTLNRILEGFWQFLEFVEERLEAVMHKARGDKVKQIPSR